MKNDASRATLQQADRLPHKDLGHEARAAGDDHVALKLWLRLLATTTQIETEIRRRLRERFGISLPRFDYLAQLERHPEGLRMNALSRRMMVTGGNVTGITDQLVAEGLVERVGVDGDRRAFRVRLTHEGQAAFADMDEQHAQWRWGRIHGQECAQEAFPGDNPL